MPEKEGLALIQEVSRDFPWIKIIAVTGGGHVVKMVTLPIAMQFGAGKVFSKPFMKAELIQAVNQELAEVS